MLAECRQCFFASAILVGWNLWSNTSFGTPTTHSYIHSYGVENMHSSQPNNCTIYNVIGMCLIKTHNSESRDQEEAGHMQRMNVIFTCSTPQKLADIVNKLPQKVLLRFC